MARHSNKNNRAIKPTSFITVICDGAPASISSRIPAGMASYSSGLKKTLSFSSLDASPSSPLLAKRLTPDLGALAKRLRALLERTATVHGTTYGAPIGTRRATPAPHIAIHESLLWRDRGECMIPVQCGGGTVEKAASDIAPAARAAVGRRANRMQAYCIGFFYKAYSSCIHNTSIMHTVSILFIR